MRIAGQGGQAVIAVMVVMLILFALAGAVAIGADTLFARPTGSSATTNDFRLRSAVNDSVAQVAGTAHACSATPPPSPLPTPTPSPIPTTLALALPSPDAQAPLSAQCVRMDGVAIDGVQRLAAPGTVCKNISLGVHGRVAVLFDVHTGSGGWAYMNVKHSDPVNGCAATPTDDDTPCTSIFTEGGRTQGGWTQVALTCDIPSGQTAQLHLKGTSTSPAQVFLALESPQGAGSVYLLSIQTPVANGREEALLFVSSDGNSRRLLAEAPLLP